MSALTFDKSELGNLEYSLQREMLATDRIGGYMSTTIVCCNTRRYHGLMVAPIDDSDRTYVLLSALDETIIQHDQTFNLALHRFQGTYEPRGHKYITDFEYTPTPTITYRVGGVILKKEMLWIHKRTQLMIRYTLVDAHSETRLRLRPFLAFRDKHALTHANMEADGHSYPAVNGVKCRLYGSFPWLYLQTSKPGAEFVPAPDWYYNFEYRQDIARGYDGYEDLMTTGYFETELKKGESIIFSASLDEMGSTKTIEEVFGGSIARRTHKIDFISCLEHSARQFLIRRPGNRTEVISGYPWHGVSGRQTFVSLPGITLWQNHKEDCIDALDTQVRGMQDGMFAGNASAAAAADAPLWFFWTLQRLEAQIGAKKIWKHYGEAMKQVLESYKRGVAGRVALNDNGLVWASSDEVPLTWMNSVIDGRSVTPRNGYQVDKIACLAQLVNVIAPIMTSDTGAWRQTIFYPYMHASVYGRGTVLNTQVLTPVYESKTYGEAPYLDSVCIWDEENDALTIFAVNKSLDEDMEVSCDLRQFEGCRLAEHIVLTNDDMKAVNTEADPNHVTPTHSDATKLENGKMHTVLGKHSWNVIRLTK